LGAKPDHGGGCLVSGDVCVGFAPVLLAPGAGVGGVDRQKADAVSADLSSEPVTEYTGRDPGHGSAETFAAPPAAQSFPAHLAGVGEIKVLHSNSHDAVPPRVVDQRCDGVADLRVTTGTAAGQIDVDVPRSAGGVAVFVEAAQCQVPVVEIHPDNRAPARTSASGESLARSGICAGVPQDALI
jgi:hypothetical protein